MTGYTVHTGASKKFVAGWDHIFSGGNSQENSVKKKTGRKKAAAKATSKRKAMPNKKTVKKVSKKMK